VASWPLPSGRRKRVKFSVNKYGEEGAFKMALKARKDALKKLDGQFDPGASRRGRPRKAKNDENIVPTPRCGPEQDCIAQQKGDREVAFFIASRPSPSRCAPAAPDRPAAGRLRPTSGPVRGARCRPARRSQSGRSFRQGM
jgi:hypothetical protein